MASVVCFSPKVLSQSVPTSSRELKQVRMYYAYRHVSHAFIVMIVGFHFLFFFFLDNIFFSSPSNFRCSFFISSAGGRFSGIILGLVSLLCTLNPVISAAKSFALMPIVGRKRVASNSRKQNICCAHLGTRTCYYHLPGVRKVILQVKYHLLFHRILH